MDNKELVEVLQSSVELNETLLKYAIAKIDISQAEQQNIIEMIALYKIVLTMDCKIDSNNV